MERHEVKKTDRIKVTESLVTEFSKNRSVLEIGAGDYSFDYSGEHCQKWVKADFAEPCDVICDFNQEKLTLPFEDTSFDLIICTEVIEHLLWPQSLLNEFHRILKDDGCIILSVPNIVSLTYRMAWLLGRTPSCASAGNLPNHLGSTAYEIEKDSWIGGHVIDFNNKKLKALLNYTKFKIIKWHSCGIIYHKQILPHWLIPASLSSNLLCTIKKNRNHFC